MGKRIGLAVSGGSDSVSLMALMRGCGADLESVTIDHGLRADARSEARFVQALCAQWGISHKIVSVSVNESSGRNLQAAARAARYDALTVWARERGLDAVLLGHTADDVAETFLMRLGRSAGLAGLSAMEPRFWHGGVAFLRPLIAQRRDVLRQFLEASHIAWCDDPSNTETRFMRVRLRNELPRLEALGLGVDAIVASADHLRQAERFVSKQAFQVAQKAVQFRCGDVFIASPELQSLEPEIHRRILTAALRWIGQSVYPPRAVEIARLQDSPQRIQTLNGCILIRSSDGLRITREYNAVKGVVARPEEVWDGRWRMVGPIEPGMQLRALGEQGLRQCDRDTRNALPRATQLASISIWKEDALVAAPLVIASQTWRAELVQSEKQTLLSMFPH